MVVVVSHHDCTGNPVSKEEHLEQLESAIKRVALWGFPVRLCGIWVNSQWQVELIHDRKGE